MAFHERLIEIIVSVIHGSVCAMADLMIPFRSLIIFLGVETEFNEKVENGICFLAKVRQREEATSQECTALSEKLQKPNLVL
jgi:uncharacterized ion transporter superfamily protein YfcC